MLCGDFILPESANYVSLFSFLNLRNLLYLIYTLSPCQPAYDADAHVFRLLSAKIPCRFSSARYFSIWFLISGFARNHRQLNYCSALIAACAAATKSRNKQAPSIIILRLWSRFFNGQNVNKTEGMIYSSPRYAIRQITFRSWLSFFRFRFFCLIIKFRWGIISFKISFDLAVASFWGGLSFPLYIPSRTNPKTRRKQAIAIKNTDKV